MIVACDMFLFPRPVMRVMVCVGRSDDIRRLEAGQQVVVGTPGRVYDMINRRALRTDAMRIFVLDEADEMLSRGYDSMSLLIRRNALRLHVRISCGMALRTQCIR